MIKKILIFLLFVTPAWGADIEGVPDSKPIFRKSVTFTKSLDKTTPFVSLEPGAVTDIQNMRRPAPGIPSGWLIRRGMKKHNSTTLGANAVNSLHQYINPDSDTRFFFAQYNSTAFHSATNDPPATGTTFGSCAYTMTGASGNVNSDTVGEDFVGAVAGASPFAWSGGTAYPDGFYVDYDVDGGETAYNDGYDFVRNGDSSSNIVFLNDTAGYAAAYIGFRRPINGFNLYFGTIKNLEPMVMAVYYWEDDGTPAWTSVSNLSDGTSSGGVSLAQDGVVTWDANPSDEAAYLLPGTRNHLYWYKITVDGSELMPNQVDRDLSGASAWANVDLNTYDESGDLSISSYYLNQYCTLLAASAPTTVGNRYRMKYDLSGVTESWSLRSFDGTQTIGSISSNGTQTELTWDATTTGGYRIVALAGSSGGNFDNFTLKGRPTNGIEVYKCTVVDDMDAITPLWSGYYENSLGCFLNKGNGYEDYSAEVIDGSVTTYVELDSLADEFYVGFLTPAFGINLGVVPTSPNGTACTVTIKYWDADSDAWTTVGTVLDGTSDGSASLAQSGTITWTGSDITEDMRLLGGITDPLYWYQLSWSNTLDNDTQVWDVAQAEKPETFQKYEGVLSYDNWALWWPGKNYRGGIDYSQQGYAHILNGPYAGETGTLFGSGEVNAMAMLSDSAFVSTKEPYRLYLLQGAAPENFVSKMISNQVGAIAPKTLVVINDGVNLFNREYAVHACMFMASDGIYMSDGVTLLNVSQPISSYFTNYIGGVNQTAVAPYIEPSTMNTSYAWVNYQDKTVHFAVPINTTGTSTQSELNRELVYSYVNNEWFDVYSRASPAACGLSLIGSNNYRMAYVGDYAGYIHRTNIDTSDNDTKITCWLKTSPIVLADKIVQGSLNYSSVLRSVGIKGKADNTTANAVVTPTVFIDGDTDGIAISSISLSRSGFDYISGKTLIPQSSFTPAKGFTATGAYGDEFAFQFKSDLLDEVMEIYGFTVEYMIQRPE